MYDLGKRVSGDSSDYHVSVAAVRNGFVGTWAGRGNGWINVRTLVRGADAPRDDSGDDAGADDAGPGPNGGRPPPISMRDTRDEYEAYVVPGHSTTDAPSIASVPPETLGLSPEGGPVAVVAWRGGDERINLLRIGDAAHVVTLDDTTSSSPAIATCRGEIFLAWRGTGSSLVNVAWVTSGYDLDGDGEIDQGVARDPALPEMKIADRIVLPSAAGSGPALAEMDGGDWMALAWRAPGDEIYVSRFSPDQVGRAATWANAWSDPVRVGSARSAATPLLLSIEPQRYVLIYQAPGGVVTTAASADLVQWSAPYASVERTWRGIGGACVAGTCIYTWVGTNWAINFRLFRSPSSRAKSALAESRGTSTRLATAWFSRVLESLGLEPLIDPVDDSDADDAIGYDDDDDDDEELV